MGGSPSKAILFHIFEPFPYNVSRVARDTKRFAQLQLQIIDKAIKI